MAQSTKSEVFVVGTELAKLSKYTSSWLELIEKIRTVYKGKLTYAAEWSNAQNIEFWHALDYIAIDAYYPLSNKINPTVNELILGWAPHQSSVEQLYVKWKKKIIFTELGYKSQLGTSIKPWEWRKAGIVSQLEQKNALEAALRTFGKKPYFAGFYIWKYFTDNDSYERKNISQGFTPYKKLAEEMLSKQQK